MKEASNIEELITKWLDDDISDQELAVLEKQKDFQELAKIKIATSQLNYAPFDEQKEFVRLQKRMLESRNKKNPSLIKWFAAAAVLAVIMAGVYTTQFCSDETISTQYASLVYTLPDDSSVHLNYNSSISFNEKEWIRNRRIQLKGEALFKVQEGTSFIVETSRGRVRVLGTQFNVMVSDAIFKVSCFEGTVSVTSQDTEIILNAHDEVFFRATGGHELKQNYISGPTWVTGEFIYDNQLLSEVLIDVATHYNIKIAASKAIEDLKFTGGFNKSNLEKALQSIEIPLGLEHEFTNDKILLTKKK
jgi:ferric-dicitrate binding protein FerR (iron transport regulator)